MNYQHAAYKDADDRGRITLGKDHANATVAVAWSELPEIDKHGGVRPSEKERNKLTELHRWAYENDHTVLDYDTDDGRIYTTDAEWVDTDVDGLEVEQDD